MGLAGELQSSLSGVCALGAPEVRENGERLAGLWGLQYEIRPQGEAALLHLWSGQQSLVRRVVRIAESSPGRVVMEVARFGHARNTRLEFTTEAEVRDPRKIDREQFRESFRQILKDQFPDESVETLLTSADLHRSFSGSYTRGLMRRGSDAYAVLAAAPGEDLATLDRMLTFGLIWLDHVKSRGRYTIQGLRLFLPKGQSAVTSHRLNALENPQQVELFEYDPLYRRLRRIARSDTGNLATWIVSRREVDQLLASALPELERIRQLSPDDIQIGVSADTQDVTLRFRGLPFARRRAGEIWIGVGDRQELLTPKRWAAVEKLVKQLQVNRSSLASDARHRLYRAQPERWLETLVAADPTRLEPRLDARYIYTQVPAFSAGDRGIIDLLGVFREGRLVVIELKAAEDMHVVMQAVDYWLRVRWHHDRDDFRRYGYFSGVELQSCPPLLFLVAPAFRFHPSNDIVLRYLSREIEVTRVGLAENWRRGIRAMFRK